MKQHTDRARVLVTLPDVAWPLDGGKRLRCAGVLKGLAEVADVDLVVLFSEAPESGAPFGSDVRVRHWLRMPARTIPLARGAARVVQARAPWLVAAQDWDAVRVALGSFADPRGYDLVWFGAMDHALELRGSIRAARSLVDADDVETDKWLSYLRQRPRDLRGAAEWAQRCVELPLWASVQRRVFTGSDGVVVCSDRDRGRVLHLGARSAHVVPNTYPDPGLLPPRAVEPPPVLLFVGNYAVSANVDAAEHLVDDVLPVLRERRPEVQVRLVGREAHRVQHLQGAEGVVLVGEVPDLRAELALATASVVPVRFGGGTRLKVLEAFAAGVPVVGTPLGVEGFGVQPGVHALVAEGARALADAVVQLLDDPGLRVRLAEAARRLYEDGFTPEAAAAAVGRAMRAVPPRRAAGGPPEPRPGMKGRLSRARRRFDERTSEPELGNFWDRHHHLGGHVWRLAARHPVQVLLAAVAIARLPVRDARLDPVTAEQRAVERALEEPGLVGLAVRRTGIALLDVPAGRGDYAKGSSKKTLRQRLRASQRSGLSARLVTDVEERRRLLALGDASEREHPDPQYRNAQPDHDDLFDCELWLAVCDGDGVPLALAVAPVAGAWAALRYFRTLGVGQAHSDSRYLLAEQLVDHLSERGVRSLVETWNPAHLPPGLRHFQRILGYRLVRVHLVTGSGPGASRRLRSTPSG